jgi:signal transduction histidine kinase
MSEETIRLLLVEDDADYAQIVRLCLGEPDAMGLVFEIDVAVCLAEALQKLSASRYHAALVDLGLPDASGLESVKAVLAAAPDIPVLVSTNMGNESTALEAMRLGAQDFMIKASTDSRLLKRSIRYAIERKAASRREELKDQWIGTLSHELRTPLAVINGAIVDLHAGRAGPLLPDQELLVGLAHRQVERVMRMIVNLLDLSRLESGVVQADLRPIDPAEVVRRVVGDFARAAADRAVRIDVDLPVEDIRWAADPDLFEQLLVNLVDNALRFARARVVVRLCGGTESIELTVHDDGVGIPAGKRENLFTRFSQLERGRRAGYKGTGLGLAICREISAMHGGSIEADSGPGRGSAFVVRLPANGARTPPASLSAFA